MTPSLIKCTHCGSAFQPKRSTAQFCSTRCRVAAHRASNRIVNSVRDQPTEPDIELSPLTPTGKLGPETERLIKRERQLMAERVSHVRHLQDFNQAATKHWEHLQRKFQTTGRSVIAHNMELASVSLRQDKALHPWAESLGIPVNSSYEDCIWATIKLARDLDKSMRLSLYLAGFIDAPGQMERRHDP